MIVNKASFNWFILIILNGDPNNLTLPSLPPILPPYPPRPPPPVLVFLSPPILIFLALVGCNQPVSSVCAVNPCGYYTNPVVDWYQHQTKTLNFIYFKSFLFQIMCIWYTKWVLLIYNTYTYNTLLLAIINHLNIHKVIAIQCVCLLTSWSCQKAVCCKSIDLRISYSFIGLFYVDISVDMLFFRCSFSFSCFFHFSSRTTFSVILLCWFWSCWYIVLIRCVLHFLYRVHAWRKPVWLSA